MAHPATAELFPRPPIPGHAFALFSLAVGVVVIWVLHTSPIGTMTLVVIVSAWVGGSRPGLLAAVLGFFALAFEFHPRTVGVYPVTRLITFLAISAFIIWIIESERKASASLRQARDALQRSNEALRQENLEGKALGERLRRNASELQLVIDTVPTMAWSLHPDGRLEFLNRRWLDYTGMRLEDALARPIDSVHPEDQGLALEQWRQMMPKGLGYEAEMRLRRADGVYRWFLVRTVPLLDEQARVVRWYGTSTDIEDRKRAEEDRENLSRRLLEVHEEERSHFARELHDEFGQLLATINLHLHAAKTSEGEQARSHLDESIALVRRAGDQVRRLAIELRPTMLETAGLDATLRWLAEQHHARTGIETRVVGRLDEVAVDTATACFRVIQQGLTNVVQHSKARHVWIELEQDDERIELALRDDGVGFDVAKTLEQAPRHGHFGLLGMKERIQILGGSLRVESKPACGTSIHVSLPRGCACP